MKITRTSSILGIVGLLKVKVTTGVQTFSPFTAIQTVRLYNLTLVHARKLKHIYVPPILLYSIIEYRQA